MVTPKYSPGNTNPARWFRAYRNQNLPKQPSIMLLISDAIAKSESKFY